MKLSSATSGGPDHIALVKATARRIIDEFEGLEVIQLAFETPNELNFEIKLEDKNFPYGSHSNISFRPDIILRATKTLKRYSDVNWACITDSRVIVFEVETDPRNIFKKLLKIECYRRLRQKCRSMYSFVLVCWADAKLPKSIAPFDEVWKFDKNSVLTN